MAGPPFDPRQYVEAIRQSGLTIYDPIEIGDARLWVPSPELQALLDTGMPGVSLTGLALRTRSKVVKEKVCRVLGYPVPPRFKRTRPRFPGQLFDTYAQKSNNLQVWNEELSSTRRYVILRVSDDDVITRVKVVTGDVLATLDTTGKLTQKFQAKCTPGAASYELVSKYDTELLTPFLSKTVNLQLIRPVNHPAAGQILPIRSIYERLKSLISTTFADSGHDQERNRGAALHRLCCKALGYAGYQDDGQFPDIRHQLVELKLQTSPTIARSNQWPRVGHQLCGGDRQRASASQTHLHGNAAQCGA